MSVMIENKDWNNYVILKLQTASWPNNIKKARTELSKNRENKNDPKNRNGKILRTFEPYIFLLKQPKTVQIS